MKKILPAMLACMLVFANADAQTARATHKKHHKHTPKRTYYYNSDGTLSNAKPNSTSPDAKRPSAYKGDNVPENDGPKKNEQRNINYNSGQPLPANNGK